MKETAERVALATLVVLAIVAVALALWKLKLVLALVFLALFLWLVVPRAVDQVQDALGGTTKAQIHREATQAKGIKHEGLTPIDRRLRELPKAGELFPPAVVRFPAKEAAN